MKLKTIFILLISLIFLESCSDDDEENCIDFEEVANVTAVEAPETATVNEPVDVSVDFSVDNSCGEFANFDESLSGTTRTIEVEAVYEGCACAEVITPREVTYTFIPEQAGEHTLRFRSGTDEFIEETIMVEDSDPEEEEE